MKKREIIITKIVRNVSMKERHEEREGEGEGERERE